jgi:hypothetical protein
MTCPMSKNGPKKGLRPLGVKIRGFEGGIGIPKHGGPLNSTGAGFLNHHTSKISINSIWMKISLWVFQIRGFEGGIRVPKHG